VQIHDNGGGADTSVAQTFAINVSAVNDTPSFTVGGTQNVAEDAGAQTVAGFVSTFSPGPADEAGQTVDFITSNNNNALFLVQPGIDASGNLTYTPAADANGSATVTVQIHDNGGGADTSVAQTFAINVSAVNDTPTLTATGNNTNYTPGYDLFSGVTTTTGPANESSQLLDKLVLTITNVAGTPGEDSLTIDTTPVDLTDANSVTTLGPLGVTALVAFDSGTATATVTITRTPGLTAANIDSLVDGLTYTDTTVAMGEVARVATLTSLQDNGGTAPGVDTATLNITSTVTFNTAPTATDDALSATEKGGANNATGGSNPSGNVITGTGGATADTDTETPGALTVVSFGTGGAAGPNNGTVDGTTQLTGDHGTLTLAANGTFQYLVNQTDPVVQALVPASTALTDTFHYTLQDGGGLTDIAVITVSISGANDLPLAVTDTGFTMGEDEVPNPKTFDVRANDFLDPDAGAANTVSTGAVTVSSTPVGTSFLNSDASAAPADSNHQVAVTFGAAFQQLHATETATVTVTYTLTGNGVETSTTDLVVTVNGANDVPIAQDDTGSMTEDQSGTAFTVLTGAGADTLDPDHGAPNSVSYDAGTHPLSIVDFPAGTGIDASDVSVTVNVSNQIVVSFVGNDFQKMKQGEVAHIDVPYTLHGDQAGDTSLATLHVTVNGANDAPTGAQNFNILGPESAIGNTSLVFDDGTGPAAPDPAGPQKTISGSLLTGATDVDGPNALTTLAVTNQVTTHGHVTISTSGEFSYTPTAGYIGSDSFNYTITDGNTPTAGTVSGSVTINIATPRVWYVNADGADGDGTSANPFNNLSHFSGAGGVDAAGDTIFLYNASAHYTGGLTLENNEKLIGQDVGLIVTGTTLETATGINGAIIDGGVVLGSGDTLRGVTLGNTSAGTALSGTNFGTLNVDNTVVNTNNNGIILNTGAFGAGASFTSVTSSGPIDVSLTGVTGSVDFGTGSMGGQFIVNGGTVSTTYSGNLSQATNAAMLDVSGGHSGTLTFQTGTLNATNGTGLQFNNADGAYNFLGTTALNGGDAGVDILNGSAGTFTFSNASITNPAGTAFNEDSSAATVTYNGTISQSTAHTAVAATSNTGGTLDFNGAVTASTSTVAGVSITGNSNTAVQFDGGLNIDTTTGLGFNAAGSGTTTIRVTATAGDESINSTTGQALNLVGVVIGTGGLNFDSTTSGGGTNNIKLQSVTGSAVALGTGALSGSTGSAFLVGDGAGGASTGGTAAISYAGSISAANGASVVNIQDHSTGAVTLSGNLTHSGTSGAGIVMDDNSSNFTFSGTTNSLSTGTSNAINITEQTSSTVAFSGPLNIDTSTGTGINLGGTNTGTTFNFTGGNLTIDATGAGNGFIANGGGTAVNVTGTGNHIATVGGTALNITNTTIGSSHVTFNDINANGGTNGIVLNNTGTSGHLAVTGLVTNGGTIHNTTGDGVSLTDTQDVSLSKMTISDNAGSGINGLRVNGVVLAGLTLNSNADAATEAGILFNELTGNGSHVTTFTNLNVSNSFTHNVHIINSGGVLTNLAVSGSTFSNDGSSNSAGSDFIFESATAGVAGTPTMTLTANNNTFTGNNAYPGPGVIPGTGLFVVSNDGTVNVHAGETTGNTFNNLNNAINLTQSSNAGAGTGGNLNFTIKNNTITNSDSTAVNVFSSGDLARTLDGIIQDNIIGTQGVAISGSRTGNGIRVGHESLGVAKVLIDGNTVQSIGVNGISGGDSISVTQLVQPGTVHATVTDNIIRDNASSRGITITATLAGATINADVHGNTITNVNNVNAIRFIADGLGANDGSINVPQASEAAIETANGGATALTDARTFFSQPAPLTPAATPQFAAQGQGPGGFATLTAAMLAPIVAEAIAHWAEAGATPQQIALLNSTHVTIEDLSNGILGNTNAHGIQIDADAAGWGWFVDATPADNSEFHATSSATELAATSGAAAAHVDLLTVVEHELGHIIGLGDSTSAGVMNIALDSGERRIPDAVDVAQASEADIPQISQAPAGTPIVAGNAGNNIIDAGHGGNLLFGGGGADTFVFGPSIQLNAPTPAPLTHVADYSAALGDVFDFSALTSAFHNSSMSDALVVRAVEDASGKFATLQVDHIDPMGLPSTPNWVSIAQIDGAHAGDAVNVVIDNHSVHLAQIHVDLLV
jgi:VCBS repeat-containing protein